MEWEFTVLNYIQDNIRSETLDKIMPVISLLGALGAFWIIITIISLITKKYRTFGRSMAVNMISNLVVCNMIFKPIVGRIRPYELNTTVNLMVNPEIDPSFPSGHTFFAFGAATVFFMYNKKLGILMYIIAAAIAFSRLYLYVHFPTDVACGAVFGIITAIIAHKIELVICPRKEEKQ